jgi:hypothetical protein
MGGNHEGPYLFTTYIDLSLSKCPSNIVKKDSITKMIPVWFNYTTGVK